jgi:hypothetical protein
MKKPGFNKELQKFGQGVNRIIQDKKPRGASREGVRGKGSAKKHGPGSMEDMENVTGAMAGRSKASYSSRLLTMRILSRVCSAVLIAPDFNSFS